MLVSSAAIAGTFTAATCSPTDVQAQLALAFASVDSASTVRAPGGNCDYTTTQLTVDMSAGGGKSITMQWNYDNAGSTITDNSSAGFLTVNNATSTHLFKAIGNGTVVQMTAALSPSVLARVNGNGSPSGTVWDLDAMIGGRITGFTFNYSGVGCGRHVMTTNGVFFLFDHNTVNIPTCGTQAIVTLMNVGNDVGSGIWQQWGAVLGTLYATYIEDNVFNYGSQNYVITDCYGGGAWVARHNTINNSFLSSHGMESGNYWSCLRGEGYFNTYNDSTGQTNKELQHSRGGQVISFGETLLGTTPRTSLHTAYYRAEQGNNGSSNFGTCRGIPWQFTGTVPNTPGVYVATALAPDYQTSHTYPPNSYISPRDIVGNPAQYTYYTAAGGTTSGTAPVSWNQTQWTSQTDGGGVVWNWAGGYNVGDYRKNFQYTGGRVITIPTIGNAGGFTFTTPNSTQYTGGTEPAVWNQVLANFTLDNGDGTHGAFNWRNAGKVSKFCSIAADSFCTVDADCAGKGPGGSSGGTCSRFLDGDFSTGGVPCHNTNGRGPQEQLIPVMAFDIRCGAGRAYCGPGSSPSLANYVVGNGAPAGYLTAGVDYLYEHSSFSCADASDIGVGTLAARPAAGGCAEGAGYYATDSGAQGTLYRIQSGAWATYYTPAVYPHPLNDATVLNPTATLTFAPAQVNAGSTVRLNASCTNAATGLLTTGPDNTGTVLATGLSVVNLDVVVSGNAKFTMTCSAPGQTDGTATVQVSAVGRGVKVGGSLYH
jgi:hypothetical protein